MSRAIHVLASAGLRMVMVMLLTVGVSGSVVAGPNGKGPGLPHLKLFDTAGKPVVLSSFHGRPLVINLWATWCPPCRREMPVLAQAAEQHPEVGFLFVNQAESAKAVTEYLEGAELALQHVLLDRDWRVAHHFGASGLPTTLFLNTDGVVVATHLGEVTETQLEAYMRRLQ